MTQNPQASVTVCHGEGTRTEFCGDKQTTTGTVATTTVDALFDGLEAALEPLGDDALMARFYGLYLAWNTRNGGKPIFSAGSSPAMETSEDAARWVKAQDGEVNLDHLAKAYELLSGAPPLEGFDALGIWEQCRNLAQSYE